MSKMINNISQAVRDLKTLEETIEVLKRNGIGGRMTRISMDNATKQLKLKINELKSQAFDKGYSKKDCDYQKRNFDYM